MKRLLLAAAVFAAIFCNAQSGAIDGNSEKTLHPDLRLSETETKQMFDLIRKEKARSLTQAKTSGGVFSRIRLGATDTLSEIFGGSGVNGVFSNFQYPIYKDSTVRAEFSNSLAYVGNHSLGGTFDPTSLIYGLFQFADTDPYTLDDVHILGNYRTPSSIPNPNGDSLIVEIVYGSPHQSNIFRNVFRPPNSLNFDTCRFSAPGVAVVAGRSYHLSGASRIRRGIELTAADVNDTGTSLYGIPVGINIPAGNIVGYDVTFKSNYTINRDDIYFSTIMRDNAVIPNFAGRVAQETNIPTPARRWFCDPDGYNHSYTMSNNVLYQTYSPPQDFLNEILAPRVLIGIWTYVTISGKSTVNIDENITDGDVSIFPNPSKGIVNIEISKGGFYKLEVVNMLGQRVYAENISANGNNERTELNLSNLAKGIYVVNFKGENFSKSTKLTIK